MWRQIIYPAAIFSCMKKDGKTVAGNYSHVGDASVEEQLLRDKSTNLMGFFGIGA